MRELLFHSTTLLIATPVLAYNATVSLEVDGSNMVEWSAIENGFILDIVITCDDPQGMSAFGVTLDGDPGFAYAGFTTTQIVPGLSVIDNYDAAQGWDNLLGGMGSLVGAGSLPMDGPPDGEVGTFHGASGLARNGRAAWIEFVALPEPGSYTIGASDAHVGDHEFHGTDITVLPLRITVTPEPMTLGLLVPGSLAMMRRKRPRLP